MGISGALFLQKQKVARAKSSERFARAKRSERCGHCHTCLNPKLKKACLTLRAKQVGTDEGDAGKVSVCVCVRAYLCLCCVPCAVPMQCIIMFLSQGLQG